MKSKLETCVIVTEVDSLGLYRHNFKSPGYDSPRNISSNVADGGLHFVSLNTDVLPAELNRGCDLLIVEDEWEPAAFIASRSANCPAIRNVVIATSPVVVRKLLESSWDPPPIATLDFLLIRERNDQGEPDWPATFKRTEDLYRQIKELWAESVIVGITAWESDDHGKPVYEDAGPLVNVLRENGDDVFTKNEELWSFIPHLMRNCLSIYRLRHERKVAIEMAERAKAEAEEKSYLVNLYNPPSLDKLPSESPVDYIIGKSVAMRYIYYYIHKLSGQPVVNIQGETGTGKKLIAKALHELSDRSDRPFITVDCGRLTDSQLLEAELFGYERGAFTGADRRKQGLFEVANGGSIFLDEIGEIGEGFQLKLLHVLEEGSFKRVGGTESVTVDVNVITATIKDLDQLKDSGKMRPDLFFRLLSVFPKIPSLRDRKEDIPLLANHFMRLATANTGIETPRFSPEALELLRNHSWEGNIRELKSTIESTVKLLPAGTSLIEAHMLTIRKPISVKNPKLSELYKVDMARAYEWLEALEKGAQATRNDEVELTHENVGRRLVSPDQGKAVTGNRVSQVFRDYREEMISLCESNTGEWPLVRKLRGFPR